MASIRRVTTKLMRSSEAALTGDGFSKAEQLLGVKDLFDPQDPWAHTSAPG